MNDEPSKGPGTNTGHGHVWKRPDRAVARCGGPTRCARCQVDAVQWPAPSPEDLVKQINELRAERDQLREALRRIVDAISPDDLCSCTDCDRVRADREQVLAAGSRLVVSAT